MRDMVFDLNLPALSWLLGKGRLNRSLVSGQQQWLSNATGLANFPYAALRANAGGDAGEDGRWLCLDPIRLRVERTQFIVEEPSSLHITAEEAAALVHDLAPLFAELGELHIASPHEWHLHLATATPLRTTPLPDAVGFNGDNLMPQADNASVWRRLLNEAQMLLHAHPINRAREQRGLPTINSLWPWGEGALEAKTSLHWHSVQGHGALWQGFAQFSNAAWSPVADRFNPSSGKTLIVHAALAESTAQGDAMRWREAMKQLESDWFAPMVAALQDGTLHEVVLHGMGTGHALAARVTKNTRLAFWRSPASLDILGIQP
jgi:hypothetical protein